jgi:hypothetical protein
VIVSGWVTVSGCGEGPTVPELEPGTVTADGCGEGVAAPEAVPGTVTVSGWVTVKSEEPDAVLAEPDEPGELGAPDP